ncbi:MAG TPA: NIPSNAP family protein [Aliidongia sp.]|uniref:NIPSNAP family protein n=1 Tax=Aliidongia sp. TaxID=1914230 RepID=UPI002DDD8250|nr:NIPSNAP family protein [Aliidongia sp.]HEV2675829.1 NIPSNAP family protein [Aliidongia sp.]
MPAILELRRYTLHAGRRDDLIELFDRELVESQEAVGLQVVGQFRDLDDPDQFVWLRGFADMPGRAEGLGAFYGGPVWQAHRAAANTTMLDSSNVLLLRPAGPDRGFCDEAPRPTIGATECPNSLVTATIYRLRRPADAAFVRFFEQQIVPVLVEAGARPIAAYQTYAVENNFPALPVRTDHPVFVWFARFDDMEAHRACEERLARSKHWTYILLPALADHFAQVATVLRLAPTARSRLR